MYECICIVTKKIIAFFSQIEKHESSMLMKKKKDFLRYLFLFLNQGEINADIFFTSLS